MKIDNKSYFYVLVFRSELILMIFSAPKTFILASLYLMYFKLLCQRYDTVNFYFGLDKSINFSTVAEKKYCESEENVLEFILPTLVLFLCILSVNCLLYSARTE
jgi:hypothetical protein